MKILPRTVTGIWTKPLGSQTPPGMAELGENIEYYINRLIFIIKISYIILIILFSYRVEGLADEAASFIY